MNHRAIAATAVAAIFLVSVSSVAFADGSDAYVMTEGSNGLGFSIKDMAKEDQDKILLPSTYEGRAIYILGMFLDDTAHYDISSIEITDYAMSGYGGQKISGNEFTFVNAESESFKITFEAKCTAAGNNLFDDDAAFADIWKEVGMANQTQADAKFTVTAKAKSQQSTIDTNVFEKNSAGNLMLVKEKVKNYANESLGIEVKYSYAAAEGPREIDFDVSVGEVVSMDFTNEYDFAGVPIADATAATRCIVNQDVNSYYSHNWLTAKYDGEKKGREVYDAEFQNTPEYKGSAYYHADEVPNDLTVATYDFYQSGADFSFFGAWSDIDDSLRSNDAMKQFLERNGSMTETYDGAESGAEDIYDDMINVEGLLKILGIVGIVFLLFIVAVIILIVVLVKARKK